MKRTLFAIFFLPFFAVAQQYNVQQLAQESYKINSAGRAELGLASNQAFINFTLPANTVYLYYTIATRNGNEATQALKLTARVADLVSEGYAFTAIANAVQRPNYGAPLHIQLIEGRLSYNAALRNNFTGGTVGVPFQWIFAPKYLTLLLTNPSTLNAAYVDVEIAAVVEK